jgi:hypothetical protein
MMRKLFFFAFYSALTVFLVLLVRRNLPALTAIPAASLAILAPFPFLVGLQMFFSAKSNQMIFSGYMEGNTLAGNVRLSLINTLGNLLPISLGLVSKGVYAKKVNKLDYPAFIILTAHQVGASLLWNGLACLAFAVPARSWPWPDWARRWRRSHSCPGSICVPGCRNAFGSGFRKRITIAHAPAEGGNIPPSSSSRA